MMLRVSRAEHKLFHRLAENQGLSLSAWARMHLLEAVRRDGKIGKKRRPAAI